MARAAGKGKEDRHQHGSRQVHQQQRNAYQAEAGE
jgi:hypothetical protein